MRIPVCLQEKSRVFPELTYYNLCPNASFLCRLQTEGEQMWSKGDSETNRKKISDLVTRLLSINPSGVCVFGSRPAQGGRDSGGTAAAGTLERKEKKRRKIGTFKFFMCRGKSLHRAQNRGIRYLIWRWSARDVSGTASMYFPFAYRVRVRGKLNTWEHYSVVSRSVSEAGTRSWSSLGISFILTGRLDKP